MAVDRLCRGFALHRGAQLVFGVRDSDVRMTIGSYCFSRSTTLSVVACTTYRNSAEVPGVI